MKITPSKLYRKYRRHLTALDFLLLLSRASKKHKEWLLAHPNYSLPLTPYLLFRYNLWQLRRGYSVAAITKHKEFFGLDFFVNKNVLIPRPETELLVEEALEKIERLKDQKIMLVDVGTGSGCISISIAKTIKQWNNGTIKIYATDISRCALRVARKNARTHNVSINFLRGNLLEPFIANYCATALQTTALIITANLPYLTAAQFAHEPSIHREPRLALVADNNGLALYEKLLKQIQSLLLSTPYSLLLFLEIDPSQSAALTALIQQYLPAASIEIKTDLAGRDRVIVIKQITLN